jgi:membrane-associated phospholipid phosphatase
MDNILNSGIPFILAFQNLGDWLLPTMKIFSFLGTEDFYLILLPIIYWGVDAGLGLRLGLMVGLTSGINSIFKLVFHSPRPYWVNTEVQAFSSEASFGAPSGHAQNALTMWGVIGTYLRKTWVWVLLILIILGISFSRLYLAVHFPLDTLLGWLIGFVLLVSFNRLWDPLSSWAKKQAMTTQIGSAFLAAMVILLAGIFARASLGDWTMTTVWVENAARAGGHAPDPLSLDGLITSSAIIFGLLSGLAWIAPKGGYQVDLKVRNRVLQYLVGIIGLVFFYLGLKVLFPSGENLTAYSFRFIRYMLVGFWVTGLAPFVFLKLKLTSSYPK